MLYTLISARRALPSASLCGRCPYLSEIYLTSGGFPASGAPPPTAASPTSSRCCPVISHIRPWRRVRHLTRGGLWRLRAALRSPVPGRELNEAELAALASGRARRPPQTASIIKCDKIVLVSYRPLGSVRRSARGSIPAASKIVSCCLVLSCQDGRTCGCLHSTDPPDCMSRGRADVGLGLDEDRRGFMSGTKFRLTRCAAHSRLAPTLTLGAYQAEPLYVACHATPTPVVMMAPPTWREKVREREAIVAALLRDGANVDARYRSNHLVYLAPECDDETPLMAAVWDRRRSAQ